MNFSKKLIGRTITSGVEPKDVKIFYEDGVPYLNYVGTSVCDNGFKVRVIIPKMSLKLENITINTEIINKIYKKGLEIPIHTEKRIYSVDEQYAIIEPIEREVTKEDLEKELGYKLNIAD